jgi:hypothetical protein
MSEVVGVRAVALSFVVVLWLVGVYCGRGKVVKKRAKRPPPTMTYPLELPKQPHPHTPEDCRILFASFLL